MCSETKAMLYHLLLTCALLGVGDCFIQRYSRELEMELRSILFTDYEVWQRPYELNFVRTTMNILALNYLDIKEQKLSIKAYFLFEWLDPRLIWADNATFTNIRFLFSNENNIWKPALMVENSVDDIDVISKPNMPMRIVKSGLVAWMPAGIFTTYCESDITYWPLDTQTCEVILSSWGYTATEVDLIFNNDQIVTKFYQENGEWEFINKTTSRLVTERDFESFSRLKFTLTFRRRPLFHMLNTLFPVILMGFLTVAIFKLSPESGERVGLALTILLAYAVYLTLISESIPQTSITASLLSAYLASILLLQTLAVLLTVFYLDIYFTPETQPIPGWLQFVASTCLARILCKRSCRRRDRATSIAPLQSISNNTLTENGNKMKERKEKKEIKETREKKRIIDALTNKTDIVYFQEGYYSWKEIALTLDKFTMYVYLVFVTGATISCFGVMLHHYNSSYSSM